MEALHHTFAAGGQQNDVLTPAHGDSNADTGSDSSDIGCACLSLAPDAGGSGRGTGRWATGLIGATGQGKTSTQNKKK